MLLTFSYVLLTTYHLLLTAYCLLLTNCLQAAATKLSEAPPPDEDEVQRLQA